MNEDIKFSENEIKAIMVSLITEIVDTEFKIEHDKLKESDINFMKSKLRFLTRAKNKCIKILK